MSFMDGRTEFRVNHQQVQEMKYYVDKYPDKYFNVSHFIRCAIMRELQRCKNVKSKR